LLDSLLQEIQCFEMEENTKDHNRNGAIEPVKENRTTLQKMSEAMDNDDKAAFKELLASLPLEHVTSSFPSEFHKTYNGSILFDAVTQSKVDFIHILLDFGVDATIRAEDSFCNPLESAADDNSVEILAIFAERSKQNRAMTKAKLLMLMIKCEEENEASVGLFKKQLESLPLPEEDHVDYSDDGFLLHFAVSKGLKEHVQLLLAQGCNPKVLQYNNSGTTSESSALELAIERNRMDIWKIMSERVELTDEEKLEQLFTMLTVEGNMEKNKPCTEFKQLLMSTLPVELVSTSQIQSRRDDDVKGTLLQVAIDADNEGVVDLLLEKGVDPDRVNVQRLLKAISEEDEEEATKRFKEILGSLSPEFVGKIDVNDYGNVLNNAVFEGKINLAQLLLQHGVDPSIKTGVANITPVQAAAALESSEMLTLFAEFAPHPLGVNLLKLVIECEEEEGEQGDSVAAFKQLLQSLEEAERKQLSDDGFLLHTTVVRGLKEHVGLLLDAGFDPKRLCKDQSPLETAIEYGRREIWHLIRGSVELTDLEKLDQLVEMMVDWDPWWSKHHANSRDEENPFEEFKEILNSLPVDLVSTASLEEKGSEEKKRTLLQIAVANDNKEAVQLLLEKGADPKAKGEDARTLIELATGDNELVDIVYKVLGEEVPVKVRLRQLSKCMYFEGGEEKFPKWLQLLTPEEVTYTSVDDGGSLLQITVHESRPFYVRLLLEFGVDVRATTFEEKRTPMTIALEECERNPNRANMVEIANLVSEALKKFQTK